jgi:hypothetical protein
MPTKKAAAGGRRLFRERLPIALARRFGAYIRRLHQSFWSLMLVVLNPILVAHHFAIQFVDQIVHGGVQICVRAFCKQIASLDVNVAFRTLSSFLFLLFFDGEEHFDIHHLVKVSGDTVQFGCDVISQGWGNFKVVPADRQIHE